MSTLFPIAELLTIAVFAASMAAVVAELAPRPRRILAERGRRRPSGPSRRPRGVTE